MLTLEITTTELESNIEFWKISSSLQKISFVAFFIFVVCLIKIKATREIINKFKTRREFTIKRIKRRKDSIKTIIDIYYKTFDFFPLLDCYIFQR